MSFLDPFTTEHNIFRRTVRDFVEKEIKPRVEDWEETGDVPRRVFEKLGELGMMAMAANPGNVIAMAPALIVTKDEIDEGIGIMDQALEVADVHAEA